MSETDERYELLMTNTNVPAYWIQDTVTIEEVVLNWELLGRGVNTAGLVAMCERLARCMGDTNE